jgi:hypothetical protein
MNEKITIAYHVEHEGKVYGITEKVEPKLLKTFSLITYLRRVRKEVKQQMLKAKAMNRDAQKEETKS